MLGMQLRSCLHTYLGWERGIASIAWHFSSVQMQTPHSRVLIIATFGNYVHGLQHIALGLERMLQSKLSVAACVGVGHRSGTS
jgi:hypothetical protein